MHPEQAHAASGSGAAMAVMAVCLGAATLLYLAAYLRERRHGRGWSRWRVASFVLGMAMVLGSLLPPLAARAHHELPAHMFQHLLLGMLGPIAIVLGTPVTLALRNLPPPVSRRIVGVLHSRPARLVSHPVTALLLNIGGMAALYLTPLYAMMAEHPALHVVVHVHFLAAGYLFSWAILQLEPAGSAHVSAPKRLAVLFVAIAAHAVLAKAMYAFGFPRGTVHGLAEIELAAQIMYYGGDLSELLLMIVLFATWPHLDAERDTKKAPAEPGLLHRVTRRASAQ